MKIVKPVRVIGSNNPDEAVVITCTREDFSDFLLDLLESLKNGLKSNKDSVVIETDTYLGFLSAESHEDFVDSVIDEFESKQRSGNMDLLKGLADYTFEQGDNIIVFELDI